MRKLAENEMLSLTGLLKMEKDGLAIAKALQTLVTDEDLEKQAEATVLATEGRIKGIQQFINENQITSTEEVR